MKTQIIIALLALTLAACTPEFIPAPTDTPFPTATSTYLPPTQTPTLEVTPTILLPTPFPTEPTIPIITPNPVQIERWKEYEDALATALFPPKYIQQSPSGFLCEWEILGQSDQEVYVWAEC